MIVCIVNKVTTWTSGIAHLGFPHCLEFVIVCPDYESKYTRGNFFITYSDFGRLLDLGIEEQNPTHIDLEKLVESYGKLGLDNKNVIFKG